MSNVLTNVFRFLIVSIDRVILEIFGKTKAGWILWGDFEDFDGEVYISHPPLMNAVTVAGTILGLEAARRNFAQRRSGQVAAWVVWLTVCVVDLILLNGDVGYVASIVEYIIAGIMRAIWIWVLCNWTFSRKGFSWSMYPSSWDMSASS